MNISDTDIKRFTSTVWRHYRKHARNNLAWRKDISPYGIVVSEIMLQQTQVARVEQYFDTWMKTFPDWQALADAKLSEVLRLWKGLGYNRRARFLHQCAKRVVQEHSGVFPMEQKEIIALPGIGVYTASAIQSFAYNKREVLIETNTRTAVIYHFFKNADNVSEKEIRAILERCFKSGTKAYGSPREWNWALFDYGSYLKKEVGNLNRKSKSYSKQSRFEGSDRQIRSGIVHYLTSEGASTLANIFRASRQRDTARVEQQLDALIKEGMVVQQAGKYRIND